jgi:hypothetical protein
MHSGPTAIPSVVPDRSKPALGFETELFRSMLQHTCLGGPGRVLRRKRHER